jgi:hypothetical protein
MSGIERSPELYARYCAVREMGRKPKDIVDLNLIPGLQRETARRFERSFKAGSLFPLALPASKAGPATLAARSPKPDRPAARRKRRCSQCCQPAELGKDGKCADREACEAVAAPLFDLEA